MKKILVALTAAAMLMLLVGCGEVSSGGSAGEPDNAAPAAESVQEPSESEAVEEPAEADLTTDQEQAVETAQSYLETGSFSRKGLIEQLRFEEFSKAQATFAVDYIDPNWNAQAEQTAQNYLDTGSFSRKGLISQLVFEGFTRSQAEHGVKAVYEPAGESSAEGSGEATSTTGREQAVEAAKGYLEMGGFSRKGLINQLHFEGFSKSEATFAVDQLDPNWNKQAELSAQSYLDMGGFSRSALIDQLVFDGFTRSQAEHGVNAVY